MILWRSVSRIFIEMRSRYIIVYLIIIPILFGCVKKEDLPADRHGKTATQSKVETVKEDTEAKPHPVLPAPANGEKDKNMEQAENIMAQLHGYRERLDKNPKDLEALIMLGNANYDLKRYDKAKALYIRAIEIDSKNLFVRTDLASTYRYTGEVEKAISELRAVLSLDASHETALYNLGVILLNDKKDLDGAIKAWENLISHNPNSAFSKELQKRVAELKKSGALKRG